MSEVQICQLSNLYFYFKKKTPQKTALQKNAEKLRDDAKKAKSALRKIEQEAKKAVKAYHKQTFINEIKGRFPIE